MARQGKCEWCKIRYRWKNNKVKLGECWCPTCGSPLKATTHQSMMKLIDIDWRLVDRVPSVEKVRTRGGAAKARVKFSDNNLILSAVDEERKVWVGIPETEIVIEGF